MANPLIAPLYNFFKENVANYGQNLAYFPFRMKFKFINLVNYQELSYDELIEYPTLSNINSGDNLEYRIIVNILDFYENLICSLNNIR